MCVHVCTCGLWHKHVCFGNHCQKHVIAPAIGDIWCTLWSICMLLYWSRHMDEWCIASMVICRWCGGVVWFFHSAIWPSSPLVFKVKSKPTALSAKDQRLCRAEECVCLNRHSIHCGVEASLSCLKNVFSSWTLMIVLMKLITFTNGTLLTVKTFQSCQDLN